MVALDTCNLCGGQGFVHFYHDPGEALEEGRETRQCPSCQGAGSLEPWRQAATGLHGPGRLEEAELRAVLRLREE